MSEDVIFAIRGYLALVIVCLPLALLFKLFDFILWPVPLGLVGVVTFWGIVACVWLALGRVMPRPNAARRKPERV